MADVKHEDLLRLLPAYALDSLDTHEAELVNQHLPNCKICQAELASYVSVVDALPLAAPEVEPPPALKERLMSGIQPSPVDVEEAATQTAAAPEQSWWDRLNTSIQDLLSGPKWQPVAILFLAILVLSNVVVWQLSDGRGGDSWRRVRLEGTDAAPEATGIIYISADGENGTIIVDGLPTLGSDQEYQLWLIENGERTSGVVFSVDDSGYNGIQIQSPKSLREYGAFGVTVEPAGGSPAPTGERVLGYNL